MPKIFIFNKIIDRSILKDGFSIPLDYVGTLYSALNIDLKRGQEKLIDIHINNEIFTVKLKNQKFNEKVYPEHADVIQIRYSEGSAISKYFRSVFYHTLEFIKNASDSKKTEKSRINIPTEDQESLDVYVQDNHILFICHTFGKEEELYPEVTENSKELVEGRVKTVLVDKYERNPLARKKCIEHYGCRCQICGIDFEKEYGDIGRGFIHVHHLVPLYKIQQDYEVDPVNDLIPVCPNCHAMIHRLPNLDELSVEDLKRILKKI